MRTASCSKLRPQRRRLSLFALVGIAVLVPVGPALLRAQDSARQRLVADFGWKFSKDNPPDAAQLAFDDTAWRKLNVPHDWSIEGPYSDSEPAGGSGGYLPTGIGWYRRHFAVPPAWRGKKVFVEFDGVYMHSDVWINGQHLGHRPFGYLGFEYDLTPHLKSAADNVIAVRVDNSRQPNSRWYSGSGIYRHVWITVTDPLHVAHWGTYVTTPKISADSATVQIRTQVQNDHSSANAMTLVSQVLNSAGQVVATAETKSDLAANSRREFNQNLEVAKPALWSLESPTLYRLRSVVKRGNAIVDEYETPFGIREIHYDTDKGFLLNGRRVKMQGMCLHHDAGSVGAAVPETVWERRLRSLQQMGCNAIRMSHNPPAPELLDLCDRLGFLVMDEAFDEWKRGKVAQGYSRFYDEWAIKDLTDMLHRDRNHPSIVLWSVGNEIPEQTHTNGANVLRPLVETCHREDPTRPVTAACDNIFTDRASATVEFLNLLDIVGYNYADRWGSRRETQYADDRHEFPKRKFIGTENVIVRDTRGQYTFRPMGPDQIARADYASSMIRAEQVWKFVKIHDYLIGDFLWTGIDYLGESRWPRKLAASGALDTCGFPKDNFYFYQSQWATNTMLHIFPHWNWKGREGLIVPVIAYTSCDAVELFLNGKSFGVKALEFPRQGTAGGWNRYPKPQNYPTTADLHLAWDVPWEPGTLKAVGYKDGRKACEAEVRTAGEAAAIEFATDRKSLSADGRDVAHLSVKIVDERGTVVPTAANAVTFDVQGAGALIGVDNGNPSSHEDYKSNRREAFNGLCLAIVQAAREPGKLRVAARADGLRPAVVELEVLKPTNAALVLP